MTTSLRVSVLLLTPGAGAPRPDRLARDFNHGLICEIVAVGGDHRGLGPKVREAAERSMGDWIWPLPDDAEPSPETWDAVRDAIAARPDAAALAMSLAGLRNDPRWRGRRARRHGANLESVRFAGVLTLGAVVARRSALVAALQDGGGDDWWAAAMRSLARRGRFVRADGQVRRRRLAPGEPRPFSFAPPAASTRPKLLMLGPLEVSMSLYFDFLEAEAGVCAGFRPFTSLAVDAAHLAGADLVVLVRDLARFWDEGVVAFLDAIGAPYVWFTDDNFLALRSEGGASRFFSESRMRRALEGAVALWASTPALAKALAPLHERIETWGPVIDPALKPPPPRAGPLTIALAGGDFRLPGLRAGLNDRLRALAQEAPLRLLATPAAGERLRRDIAAAEVVVLPPEPSFRQFIRAWGAFAPDILLHPAGATANAAFKCPTAAIVAHHLGAAPAVTDEPAYAGWGEAEGVSVLAADGDGLELLAQAVREPERRARLQARLALAMRQRFSGAAQTTRLQTWLASRPPAPPRDLRILRDPRFAARRSVLALARATRGFRQALERPE